jgi:uncharacterized protein YpuA (DUF1002 family)
MNATSRSFEARLAVLEDALPREIQHNRNRTDLIFRERQRELVRQARETMRRLKELNGHNEETRKNLELTVSRDKYDGLVNGSVAQLIQFMERTTTSNADRDKVQGQLLGDVKTLNALKDNIVGRIAMISAIASLLGAGGVTALFNFWLNKMK